MEVVIDAVYQLWAPGVPRSVVGSSAPLEIEIMCILDSATQFAKHDTFSISPSQEGHIFSQGQVYCACGGFRKTWEGSAAPEPGHWWKFFENSLCWAGNLRIWGLSPACLNREITYDEKCALHLGYLPVFPSPVLNRNLELYQPRLLFFKNFHDGLIQNVGYLKGSFPLGQVLFDNTPKLLSIKMYYLQAHIGVPSLGI